MEANEIIWEYFLKEVNHTITAWQIKYYNAVESVKNDVREVVDGSIEAFWRGMDAAVDFADNTVQVVRDNLAKIDFTYSYGGSLAYTVGCWMFSGSIGLGMDEGKYGDAGNIRWRIDDRNTGRRANKRNVV